MEKGGKVITMTWEQFYGDYDNWSADTLKKRLFWLENYGAPDEITEVAIAVCDEAAASRLVQKAMDASVPFGPEHILELEGLVNDEVIGSLVRKAIDRGATFSCEQILCLDGLVDLQTLSLAVESALRQGASYTADQILELDGLIDASTLTMMAARSKETFTQEELFQLSGIVDEEVLEAIRKRQGAATNDAPKAYEAGRKRPGKFLAAAAFLGGLAPNAKKSAPSFRVGDRVRVKYRGQEGTVIDINGSLYMVSLSDGRYVDSYDASQLEQAW